MMRMHRWAAALAALLLAACAGQPVAPGSAGGPALPAAARATPGTDADTYFGTRVDDPYRGLEAVDAPGNQAWLKAQAAHASGVLRRIEGRDRIRARFDEIDAASAARVTGVHRLPNGMLFFERRAPQDDQFKLYVRDRVDAPDRLVFDPETLRQATGKPHAINYFTPSRDGRLVAIGVSPSGSEDASLRVVDTRTGRMLGGEISRVDWGGVTWAPDNSELWFLRRQEMKPGMPETEKYQRSTVVSLRPGETEAQLRTVVTHAGPDVAFPATEFPFLEVLSDGRVLLLVTDGVSPHGRMWHSTLERVRSGRPGWTQLYGTAAGITSFVVRGPMAYALSFQDAPRLKLLAAPLEGFDPAKAQVVLPASAQVLVELAAAQDAVYLKVRDGNANRLLRLSGTPGEPAREVPLPLLGSFYFTGSPSMDLPGVMLELQGWTRARQIMAVSPPGLVSNTGLQPAGRFDQPEDLVSTEVMVRSHDGVMVPLSIVHRRGVKLDGSQPTLLYGYASYGDTEEPFYSPSRRVWLDMGGVFAVANPRGSGVFGRQWHLDGKAGNKANTWRDFIACAEYLVQQGWTQPSRLGIWGGSAGGILVGRAMTERPDLFAAVVPEVGVLDAVRAELSANGVPNIPEFGTHKTEEGFRGLLAMSTYHHVRDGVRYPAVLLTHGLNDPRVPIWHSAKTAARLQAATSSGKPVLLRVDFDAGHGVGSTKSQQFDERADIFAFLLWQLGVPGYRPTP